eukprot:GGOE01019186.1.p1 GENE.GGOE01019186.1~~GGOE01019186.1.p1  ORF type:complete len:331 (+),score=98.55 GGOE01019186.1:59-1051(+)
MVLRLALAAIGGAAVATAAGVSTPLTSLLGNLGNLGHSPVGDGPRDRLQLELSSLRTELHQLMGRPVVVPTFFGPQSRGSVITQGLVLAGVAALGYWGLRQCGWGVADLLFVSGKTFHNTVGGLVSGMQLLGKKVHGLSRGVHELREDVAGGFDQLGEDVGAVQEQVGVLSNTVERVESSVERVETKVEHTRQGIHALCSVVCESLRGLPQTEARKALDQFTQQVPSWQLQQLSAGQIRQILEAAVADSTAAGASPVASETRTPTILRQPRLSPSMGQGRWSMGRRQPPPPEAVEDLEGEEEEEERWAQQLPPALSNFLRSSSAPQGAIH